jgi:hypothetical protein
MATYHEYNIEYNIEYYFGLVYYIGR